MPRFIADQEQATPQRSSLKSSLLVASLFGAPIRDCEPALVEPLCLFQDAIPGSEYESDVLNGF